MALGIVTLCLLVCLLSETLTASIMHASVQWVVMCHFLFICGDCFNSRVKESFKKTQNRPTRIMSYYAVKQFH